VHIVRYPNGSELARTEQPRQGERITRFVFTLSPQTLGDPRWRHYQAGTFDGLLDLRTGAVLF
jgi:hypothetical protein